MEETGISFTLTTLISIVIGIASAVGVWFKLKATVNIQAKDINNLHSEMKELKSENNEGNKLIHKRIDSQRDLIEKNRENSDSGISLMTANMNAMELRIIKAIHDIKK
jgi:cell division protein FtsB